MRIILLFLATFLFANERYLIAKFEDLKPYYYNHQIVHLKLKIISAKDGNISVVDDRNRTYDVTKDGFSYISNINFELNNTFPIFNVYLKENNVTLDSLELQVLSKVKQLYPPKKFCGIIAKDLKIKDKIMVNYDNTHNIVYWTVITYDGVGSRFKLNLQEEKLYFSDKNNTADIYNYSAIVPIDKKDFSFSYFNVDKNKYQAIKFHIEPKNETISTQTDIKPMAKTNLYIINISLGVLLVIWLLLFIYRRKIFYIILMIIVIAILVVINLPKKEIILPKGTKIHILPFKGSTIFMVLPHDKKVQVLLNKNGYKKIEINKHIGWVKDE
jgi:hypothetical protein